MTEEDLWGFEIPAEGNFHLVAILAHSGIVGDEDELYILNSEFEGTYKEQTYILVEFAKLQGKITSWHNCLVDPNYNNTNKIMILLKWCNPVPWKGEVNYCVPNKRITV
jgi:hypothetical protein